MISKVILHPDDKLFQRVNPGFVNVIVSLNRGELDRLSENVDWNMAQVEPGEDPIAFNLLTDIIEKARKGLGVVKRDNNYGIEERPVEKLRDCNGSCKGEMIVEPVPVADKWTVEVRVFRDQPDVVIVTERSNIGNLGIVINYDLYQVDVEATCEKNAKIIGTEIIELKKRLNFLEATGKIE